MVARLAGAAGVNPRELQTHLLTHADHPHSATAVEVAVEALQLARLSGPAGAAVEQPEQHRLMMALAAHLGHHLPKKQAEQHRLAMIPDSCRGHHQSLLTLASSASLGHHLAMKQSEQYGLAMATGRGVELATPPCRVLPLRRSRPWVGLEQTRGYSSSSSSRSNIRAGRYHHHHHSGDEGDDDNVDVDADDGG